MKITVKALKERIKDVREDIISSIEPGKNIFKDNTEEQLIKMLFDDIADQTDLESYIWNSVDDFVSSLSTDDIFLARKDDSLSYKISEILSEGDNILKDSSVSAIDSVLEGAAFRYMLEIASSVEQALLQVYLLDNLSAALRGVDDEKELDVSEYGTYDDEETLLDDFIDELISNISGNEKIIQIEDNHKNALADFFQLEV